LSGLGFGRSRVDAARVDAESSLGCIGNCLKGFFCGCLEPTSVFDRSGSVMGDP